MRSGRRRRGGWSLIEMCVVMFGLSLFIGLMGSVIWSTMRIERVGSDAFARMQEQIQAADLFRGDVASASDSPEFAHDFKASPLCMILRQDDGALLIYRWHDGTLERHTLGDKRDEVRQIAVGGEGVSVEFSRSGRVLTMYLAGKNGQPLVIAAAIGGDRS